jgi:hypothetical protein
LARQFFPLILLTQLFHIFLSQIKCITIHSFSYYMTATVVSAKNTRKSKK